MDIKDIKRLKEYIRLIKSSSELVRLADVDLFISKSTDNVAYETINSIRNITLYCIPEVIFNLSSTITKFSEKYNIELKKIDLYNDIIEIIQPVIDAHNKGTSEFRNNLLEFLNNNKNFEKRCNTLIKKLQNSIK